MKGDLYSAYLAASKCAQYLLTAESVKGFDTQASNAWQNFARRDFKKLAKELGFTIVEQPSDQEAA